MTELDDIGVKKFSAAIPISVESAIYDNLVTDGPLLAHLREVYAKQRAEEERQWRSLPWYVRLYRTVTGRLWWGKYRARQWLHSTLFPECDSA